jgi:hypothetical protein
MQVQIILVLDAAFADQYFLISFGFDEVNIELSVVTTPW